MPGSVRKPKDHLQPIPSLVNDTEVLYYLKNNGVNWHHLGLMRELTEQNDEVLADWLNISVRTFREYKKPGSILKANIKEQILLLVSLLQHGKAVFGSVGDFDKWLDHGNFFLDNQKPKSFLNTVSGLRLIDDQLTGMEYGDNV